MALLKWLFHKDIDLTRLKSEIGILYDLFRECIRSFGIKKNILEGFGLSNHTFRALSVGIKKANRELVKELNDEEKERRIVAIIEEHEILTKKEAVEIDIVRSRLRDLKRVLRSQNIEIELLMRMIRENGNLHFLPRSAGYESHINYLGELMDQEKEILFGEQKDLDKLIRDVVDKREFPPVPAENPPLVQTAILAEKLLSLFGEGRINIGGVRFFPAKIARVRPEILFYPGSGDDPIFLFLFPYSKIYILQDLQANCLEKLKITFKIFYRTNMITSLTIRGNKLTFTFFGQVKVLVVYAGRSMGNSTRFVPPEIRSSGVDLIMTKALRGEEGVEEKIFNNFYPYMRRGCVVDKYLVDDLPEKQNFREISSGYWQKVR